MGTLFLDVRWRRYTSDNDTVFHFPALQWRTEVIGGQLCYNPTARIHLAVLSLRMERVFVAGMRKGTKRMRLGFAGAGVVVLPHLLDGILLRRFGLLWDTPRRVRRAYPGWAEASTMRGRVPQLVSAGGVQRERCRRWIVSAAPEYGRLSLRRGWVCVQLCQRLSLARGTVVPLLVST